jgi:fatty acid/phospholipid biosynthesis enzyme
MPTIAIDTGSEGSAHDDIVAGVAEVSRATDIECLLVGDEGRIQAVLDRVPYDPEQIAVLAARPESDAASATLASALGAVARGRAHALVTAAEAAACLAACGKQLGLLPGVRRGAVGFVHPRLPEHRDQDRFSLLLDASGVRGADAEDLARLAVPTEVMGR